VMKGGFTALDFPNETTVVVTEEKEGDVLVVGIDDVTTNYEEEVAWWIFKVNGAIQSHSVQNIRDYTDSESFRDKNQIECGHPALKSGACFGLHARLSGFQISSNLRRPNSRDQND